MPEPAPVLEPLVDRLAAVPGVVAVILLGSAARDELAMAAVEGRTELFSDLDFLAVTDGHLPADLRRVALAEIGRIADGFDYANPLFHVDVLFRERRRLGTLPPFIFTYELKAMGRPMHGPDLRSEVREVNLVNLDRRNTHEILMKRLWHIAEALPAAWLRGEPLDPILARALGVILHRNPLDVTTVLLPEVGILLPSYAERVSTWRDHPELAFRSALDARFGQDSGAYLALCLAERSSASPSPDPAGDYRAAIAIIAAALDWLGWRAGAAGNQVFNEKPVTRGEWLALLLQAVRISYTFGPAAGPRWVRTPRKHRLTEGLLELHSALIAHQSGDDRGAHACLNRAVAALATVACPGPALERAVQAGAVDEVAVSAVDTADALFAERWLAVRALAGRAFWRAIRLGEPAMWTRMASSIGWDEEVV